MEGLLSLYIITYITLQTFRQECFFVRFVCFIVFMQRKNNSAPYSFQINMRLFLKMICKLGNMRILFSMFLPLLLTTVLSAQKRYDVIIDEIMVDPSPQIGLPNNEWIELKNVSALPVDLQGWRIGDSGGQSGPMPAFTLLPGSYVIVCTGSAVGALSAFGTVVAVTSFPSLDNDGEQLYLRSSNGEIIHAIQYSSGWYQNALKKEGGWSLEMIDTQNPCTGTGNWIASNNTSGGTPGNINSVNAVNTDNDAPELSNAYTLDNTTIMLVFNEPVDSVNAVAVSSYSVNGGISIASAEALPPLFSTVQLKTTAPLSDNVTYTVTVTNISDCNGTVISTANVARVGLTSPVSAGDLVINEILFNPRSSAYDYVELYNKSDRILNASGIYIANRTGSGTASSIVPVSVTPRLVFPGDHVVITEDAASLALNYLVQDPGSVITIQSLPSFPDDEGDVVVLDQQGAVIDEVKYSDDWHFKLLDNKEGVSLERIDINGPSQVASNWHSAASTAGFGTPGYKNSQLKNLGAINATVEISPKVFSPDNDGFDDIATIQYRIDQPGFVANVTIFDGAGRPVRNLVRNSTLTINGNWNWDGLDDKGLKLPVGTYIIFTEIFNLEGKKDKFKNVIVLARKFN